MPNEVFLSKSMCESTTVFVLFPISSDQSVLRITSYCSAKHFINRVSKPDSWWTPRIQLLIRLSGCFRLYDYRCELHDQQFHVWDMVNI